MSATLENEPPVTKKKTKVRGHRCPQQDVTSCKNKRSGDQHCSERDPKGHRRSTKIAHKAGWAPTALILTTQRGPVQSKIYTEVIKKHRSASASVFSTNTGISKKGHTLYSGLAPSLVVRHCAPIRRMSLACRAYEYPRQSLPESKPRTCSGPFLRSRTRPSGGQSATKAPYVVTGPTGPMGPECSTRRSIDIH